jgi:hypothetical protein
MKVTLRGILGRKKHPKGVGMTSIQDVEQVADDLESLVAELRSELKKGADFERLTQISDEISEHADNAAQTFSSVNETLMSRISELKDGGSSGSRRSGQSRQKASSSSSSSSS